MIYLQPTPITNKKGERQTSWYIIKLQFVLNIVHLGCDQVVGLQDVHWRHLEDLLCFSGAPSHFQYWKENELQPPRYFWAISFLNTYMNYPNHPKNRNKLGHCHVSVIAETPPSHPHYQKQHDARNVQNIILTGGYIPELSTVLIIDFVWADIDKKYQRSRTIKVSGK